MSFAQRACITLICDGCGNDYEDEYTVHWDDNENGRAMAREYVRDASDWDFVDGKDYCRNCSPLRGECGACGRDIRKVDGIWTHVDPYGLLRGDVKDFDKDHTPYDVDEEPPPPPDIPQGPPAGEQQEIQA